MTHCTMSGHSTMELHGQWQSKGVGGGGTFTGVAISLTNAFLLHEIGRPYILGPGRQYAPALPLYMELLRMGNNSLGLP